MQLQLVKIYFSIWIHLQAQQDQDRMKNDIIKVLLKEKI